MEDGRTGGNWTLGRMAGVTFARDPATAAYYERRAAEYDDWYEGTRAARRPLTARLERRGGGTRRAGARPRAGAHARRRVRHRVPDAPPARPRRRPRPEPVDGRDRAAPAAGRRRDRGRQPRPAVRRRQPSTGCSPGTSTGTWSPDERAGVPGRGGPGRAPSSWSSTARCGRACRPRSYQERVLKDGSRHRVFKRYLDADELAAELDGEVLLRGTWFVAARAALTAAA